MLNFSYVVKEDDIVSEHFYVDDQTYDKETKKQMKEEYGIFFLSSDDGVTPVKLFYTQEGSPRIALGEEDDGSIWFYRRKTTGRYLMTFNPVWINDLIADLESAKKSAKKKPRQFFDSFDEYRGDYRDDDDT